MGGGKFPARVVAALALAVTMNGASHVPEIFTAMFIAAAAGLARRRVHRRAVIHEVPDEPDAVARVSGTGHARGISGCRRDA